MIGYESSIYMKSTNCFQDFKPCYYPEQKGGVLESDELDNFYLFRIGIPFKELYAHIALFTKLTKDEELQNMQIYGISFNYGTYLTSFYSFKIIPNYNIELGSLSGSLSGFYAGQGVGLDFSYSLERVIIKPFIKMNLDIYSDLTNGKLIMSDRPTFGLNLEF